MRAFAVTLALVLAGLLTLATPVSGDSYRPARALIQPGSAAIRITDRIVGFHDLADGGTVWTFLLYNKGITDRSIGHFVLYCTDLGSGGVLSGGQSWCRAAFVLAKGSLYAEGIIPNRRVFYDLALTGGTGIYANVGAGHVSSSLRSVGPRTDTIIMQLYAL